MCAHKWLDNWPLCHHHRVNPIKQGFHSIFKNPSTLYRLPGENDDSAKFRAHERFPIAPSSLTWIRSIYHNTRSFHPWIPPVEIHCLDNNSNTSIPNIPNSSPQHLLKPQSDTTIKHLSTHQSPQGSKSARIIRMADSNFSLHLWFICCGWVEQTVGMIEWGLVGRVLGLIGADHSQSSLLLTSPGSEALCT